MGHNFWLKCPTDLRSTPLNYIFNALFRDTPLAYLSSRATCHVCHLTPVPCVTYVKLRDMTIGNWGIPEKSIKNARPYGDPTRPWGPYQAIWGPWETKLLHFIVKKMPQNIQTSLIAKLCRARESGCQSNPTCTCQPTLAFAPSVVRHTAEHMQCPACSLPKKVDVQLLWLHSVFSLNTRGRAGCWNQLVRRWLLIIYISRKQGVLNHYFSIFFCTSAHNRCFELTHMALIHLRNALMNVTWNAKWLYRWHD